MSSQQSKPVRLRFSGPELGDLLDRVVDEHGEEAAIAAVNRIRSGGVAGFFCREEFEVVVDPDPDPNPGCNSDPDPDRSPDPEDATDQPTVEPDVAADDETVAEAIGRRATGDPAPDRLAYRSRSRPDPSATAASIAVDDAEPTVFAGPVPPGSGPANDRFATLLERRLAAASAAEAELGLRRSRTGPDDPRSGPTVGRSVTSVPTRAIAPVAPAPAPAPGRVARNEGPVVASTDDRSAVLEAGPQPAFWRRLDRTCDELASHLPAGSPLTAVVGPLPLATAVVHRLRSTAELASADVIVLTDRAGIVAEPTWELFRTGDRLVRRLAQGDGRSVIIVLDVPSELPHWVVPLQRRLRSVGVGLFRYPIAGRPSGAELERFRQGADVPYAIDLASRVDPERVVALIADRHPIVSVAGTDLGPELLVAMRRHVGADESRCEPVTDG